MLAEVIARETQETIDLSNGITIEVRRQVFDPRGGRGRLDEIAYWPVDDAAAPDREIVAGLRPAMATVPKALLLALSSPYARRGELWRSYQRHFGREDAPALLWQADTRTMNSTVPQTLIDAAYTEDAAVARAEYGAKFRPAIESFMGRDRIVVSARGKDPVPFIATEEETSGPLAMRESTSVLATPPARTMQPRKIS